MHSPTLCRPRHLDPERLRARLGSERFQKLRYHEAAVVSTGQFHLFALSSDTLFIVPLMSRREADPDMCVPLRSIAMVERVLPSSKKQKGLLLLPTSQLFRLQLREVKSKKIPTELFFSTFEPQTQLFFQISRALRVDFQVSFALVSKYQTLRYTSSKEQRLELTNLLELFVLDLVRARDDVERAHLIDELTTAAYSSDELRQLFFEDRTQVSGCIGLVALLARHLSLPLRRSENIEARVDFLLSIARVFSAMCFDMQLRTSCFDVLAPNELVRNLLARGVESYDKAEDGSVDEHVVREDFIDAQAAVLLALDAMQQYEDFRSHQHQQMRGLLIERSTSVMQQAIRAPTFAEWLPKFFERVCIAVSRAVIAIERHEKREIEEVQYSEQEETEDEEDDVDCREGLEPSQMLALWRCVTVLDLLVRCDVASGSDQVLAILLRTRKDYIK
ncbi:CRN8 protein [Phytophthora nicotianae]|uniref:CRN8 protein n=1 Tax=Phytophthora nicotianae TaxID=4792 RepID=A0A0W8D9Y8_PHYNI|nr:CRN8 protein [Phytophthora nicotianae]